MKKVSTLLLIIIGLVLPVLSGIAANGNERLWDIQIQPSDDGSGRFTFDAVLKESFSSEGVSTQDQLRIPRMTIIPGKEANINIKSPDGRPAVTAQVVINEDGMKVKYSVMIRTEEGVYKSSADLNLSANKSP